MTAPRLPRRRPPAVALAGDLDAAQQQLAPVNGRPARPRQEGHLHDRQACSALRIHPRCRSAATWPPRCCTGTPPTPRPSPASPGASPSKTLGVITGEVGTGKTVAVRAALSGLDPTRHTVIYIGQPGHRRAGHPPAHRGRPGRAGPLHGTAALTAQAYDVLAAEAAEEAAPPCSSSTFPTGP